MDLQNKYQFNQQQSNKLAQKPIYKQYKDWLKKNGVLLDPALVYPAYFGPSKKGVIGVATNKVLPGGQGIISVPYNLIITTEKVKGEPELKKIIQQNPNIFKYNDEAAFFILTLYVCRELVAGKKSFYAPYFAIADDISLTNWTHFDLLGLENANIIRQMKNQIQEIQASFMLFIVIFRRYPNVFPQNLKNTQYKQIFQKSFNFICTRAFGWSLPSISLIPMADSLNHHNQYVTHMLIDTKMQKQPQQNYTIKSKKFNLSILSPLHPQIPKSEPVPRKKRRVDKFVDKHKEILSGEKAEKKKDPQAFILWQQYKAGVRNFRQLHFYDQSCEEDNDTDQETIEKFEYNLQKFRFYQKYQSPGITDKNKTQQLSKYWHLFLQAAFLQQQQSQPQNQTENKPNIEQIKKTYGQQSKQSEGSSLVSSSSSSDSDDEEFKWMAGNPDLHDHKTTYFVMATRKPIKKNEQVYNFYGRRSNKFLLVGYNFVLEQNKYDSVPFRINIDNWKDSGKPFETKLPVGKIINKDGNMDIFFTKQIRVKKQRVCLELINHCRALLIGWSDLKSEPPSKKIRITIPFSIQFQKKVLSLATQFIKTLQKQFMTSLQQDEQLLQKAQKVQMQSAIQMRLNYKIILREQLELLKLCETCLKNWKGGKLAVQGEQEMRDIGKVRGYLGQLERGKL